jgi:ribonuclease P protein subunit RPR2
MAKHISKTALRSLGEERVLTLTSLSEAAVRDGRSDRAKRYVDLSLRICGKARVKMPDGFRYCKKCLVPLVPGINCRVRLTTHKVVSVCECGNVWRMPYLKEQRK